MATLLSPSPLDHSFIRLSKEPPIVTYHWVIASPIGELVCTADEDHLVGLWMDGEQAKRARQTTPAVRTPVLATAEQQLTEYFAGDRKTFAIPIRLMGTSFQLRVWQALTGIGYGQTRSYASLAREVGNADACRAVGAANGRNPVSIILPCHRVIGASGRLVGYGGGLDRKRWLLDHEQAAYRDESRTAFRDNMPNTAYAMGTIGSAE